MRKNKYTVLLKKLQQELHYSNSEMREHFLHLFYKEEQENLRLINRKAKETRFKLIGK